jgi:hypothetical protein
MPAVQFQARVSHFDKELVRAGEWSGIRYPPGLSKAPVPEWISVEAMKKLQGPSMKAHTGLSGAFGLTDAVFSLSFANFKQQWRQISSRNPIFWQFQGGVIYLDLTITVYLDAGWRPHAKSSKEATQIARLMMEHELLHVKDEIDIVTNYMPVQAPKDKYVHDYLMQGKQVDHGMFMHWFYASDPLHGSHFEKWVHDSVWLPEHEKRIQKRDSGPDWVRCRQSVDALLRSAHP